MTWLLLVVPVAALAGWGLWLRLTYMVAVVEGPSMTPTFRPGDRVLVRRRAGRRLRTGEVALVDLPESLRPIPAGVSRADSLRNRRVIKRVAATAGEAVPAVVEGRGPVVPGDHLVLLGDHPLASGDSRQYGFVPVDAVVGVVLRPLPGPHRLEHAPEHADRADQEAGGHDGPGEEGPVGRLDRPHLPPDKHHEPGGRWSRLAPLADEPVEIAENEDDVHGKPPYR